MNSILSLISLKPYRISPRFKLFATRFSSLILLFQRMPVVQMLFPEANMLGGSALANSFSIAVTTVVGLGAYDSVAGATTIDEVQPLVVAGATASRTTAANAINVPATTAAALNFEFICATAPSDPESWQIVTSGGTATTLPTGLSMTYGATTPSDGFGGFLQNNFITGTPSTAGTYPVYIKVFKDPNYGTNKGGDPTKSITQLFNICALGFSTQPASTSINSGSTTTLTCVATGIPVATTKHNVTPTVTYQWYQGATGTTTTPVGTNSASFTTPALSATTNYWVKVTSTLGTSTVSANSSTATVTVNTADTTPPTVTINQAAGQTDPSNSSPVNFTVVFSEPVTNFATGDVTLTGTAGATTATVTGSGTTYNVAVSGMTGSGTVIASLAAGVASDAAGNLSTASTSTDNSITYDNVAPTVTINQAAGQTDPSNGSTLNFTVTFSESVSDFATGDVTVTGTAGGTKTATVTGSGTTYNVAVTGMTSAGTVIPSLAAGVAHDAAGNASAASTSTDNTVTFDNVAPTVTINQAVAQADPSNGSTLNFTVVFSETVTNFATGDVTITGTTGGTKTATVTGSGTTYNVAVSGMTSSGTVIASLAAGVASDAAGNLSTASTSTDNTVTFDNTAPTVTINQASGQTDPSNSSPVNFTVTFSEPVTNFATGDVTITGTAAGTKTATVTGSGTTYNVSVSGMTSSGTVIASLAAGVASDAAGNLSTASTSTDNSITYDIVAPTVTINQASGQTDPSKNTTLNFTVTFSESVSDFATGDVTITGTAGGTKTATVTGSGTTYNVAVTGMTSAGTVIASLAAGVAHDAAGNASAASTSTDNTVTFDNVAPTVTVSPTGTTSTSSPITFTLTFSESVTGLSATGITVTNGSKGALTGSGTTYTLPVTPTAAGAVTCQVSAGAATDAATNANTVSNTASVTYSPSASSGFTTWVSGLPANQQGPNQTPKNDGVTNLMKYACNLNPLAPDTRKLTVGANQTAGLPGQAVVGGKLRIEFIRRKASTNPGITYTMQFAPDMNSSSWSNQDVSTTPAGTSIDATWERVTIDDSVTGAKRFARLKIVQP